jgi:hypothetical protein
MTTIAENSGVVTLINVFTVEPSNQQKLVDILARATDTSVRDVPGFISAALHRRRRWDACVSEFGICGRRRNRKTGDG